MEAALSFGVPEDYTLGSLLNHLWGEISVGLQRAKPTAWGDSSLPFLAPGWGPARLYWNACGD